MSHRKLLQQMFSLTLIVLVLAGCAGAQAVPTETPVPPTALPTAIPVPPTATPTPTLVPPTVTPVPPPTATALAEPLKAATVIASGGDMAWDYVAIGDAVANGFVDKYAAHVEADLGVEVSVHNWIGSGQTSDVQLYQLRNNRELRDAISDAEIITFDISPGEFASVDDYFDKGTCGGSDNQDCLREGLALLKGNTDAIFAEILSLRSTSDTIIRAMTWPVPSINENKSKGVFEEVNPYWIAYNEYVVQAASEHNVPVVRVDLAFNGPSIDEDPDDKGYLALNKLHPNQVGFALIADLHRELGYEPLAP